jgi:hypothetical protein
VFELAGVLYQPHPEPIARASRKQKVIVAAQTLVPKKATEKQKRPKGSSRSGVRPPHKSWHSLSP